MPILAIRPGDKEDVLAGSSDGGVRPDRRGGKQDQVRDRLVEMVDGLQVGDAIPPERQLAETLGVSRPTLRAVIDDLVRIGVLRRRQGSGTYVAEPKVPGPLTMTSFSEDMRRRGLEPESRPAVLRVDACGGQTRCQAARLAGRRGVVGPPAAAGERRIDGDRVASASLARCCPTWTRPTSKPAPSTSC